MKKFIRFLIIIISSAVLLYGAFVGIDCVRLYKVGESNKPLITIYEVYEGNYWICQGLGYSVTYQTKENMPTEENENNNATYDICGAEFRLFNKILLWAWIE